MFCNAIEKRKRQREREKHEKKQWVTRGFEDDSLLIRTLLRNCCLAATSKRAPVALSVWAYWKAGFSLYSPSLVLSDRMRKWDWFPSMEDESISVPFLIARSLSLSLCLSSSAITISDRSLRPLRSSVLCPWVLDGCIQSIHPSIQLANTSNSSSLLRWRRDISSSSCRSS